jgi:alpha-beta hydrolase superfamily lysophospholipase
VPTSGRIFHQAATWIGTSVSPKRRAQPLLILVGEKDRTVTPYVARAEHRFQRKSSGRTEFKVFPGLSHFLIAEPGWEQVANCVLDWERSL